jgi:polyphosphate kinase
MLDATDTKHAPWYLVRSDDKRRARLNVIAHILDTIPHKELKVEKLKLPKRKMKNAYDDQATLAKRKFVPSKY